MKINKVLFVFGLFMGLLAQVCSAADYVVAVRAKNGIDAAFQQWQPTVDYLTAKIPAHLFTLKPIVSLKKINGLAAKGEFDFLITNPSSYIELKQRYGASAVVALNNRRANTAQSHFGAVIFTHAKNDDIVSLADLKSKRVMAVSDVVYAVRDGIADVGIVRTDQLERMEAEGKIDLRYFRILNNKDIKGFPFFLSTTLYPEWPFVSLNQTDFIEDIKQALLELPEDSDVAHAGKYTGWIEPLDYTSVEGLLRKLKVGPFEN